MESKYELRNNFPRAAINAIMQIKIIAARAENRIFARFVIPIIRITHHTDQKRETRSEDRDYWRAGDTCFTYLLI